MVTRSGRTVTNTRSNRLDLTQYAIQHSLVITAHYWDLREWHVEVNIRTNPIPIGIVCRRRFLSRRRRQQRPSFQMKVTKIINAYYFYDNQVYIYYIIVIENRLKTLQQQNEVARPGSDSNRSIITTRGPLTFFDRKMSNGSPAMKSSTPSEQYIIRF